MAEEKERRKKKRREIIDEDNLDDLDNQQGAQERAVKEPIKWEVKLKQPHELQSVAGYYEPVFNLNDIPEDHRWNEEQKRSFVERQLAGSMKRVYGANSSASDDKPIKGKLDWQEASRLGDRMLLSSLRSNPSVDINNTISSYRNRPSDSLVATTKAIQIAHSANQDYIDRNFEAIFEQLIELKKAKVTRNPENYPPHYGTFFNQGGDLREQLTAFFSDYSEPQESSYNQNFFFLVAKGLSRHYAPLADELVTALTNLKMGEEQEQKTRKVEKYAWGQKYIATEALPKASDEELLKEVLEKFRKELIQTMVSENRAFTESHLLRRIDYALEKIEQPQKTNENTLGMQ